jgi:hypothetical protein
VLAKHTHEDEKSESEASHDSYEAPKHVDPIMGLQATMEFGLIAKLGINREDKIMCFEELGWFDPDVDQAQAQQKTVGWLKKLEFQKNIYPEHLMTESIPKSMITPDTEFLRKLIKVTAKCTSVHEF